MESKLLDKDLSRRGLIKSAVGVAGVAAMAAGGLGFLSKAEAAKESPATLPWP
jgi:hypothetical protein